MVYGSEAWKPYSINTVNHVEQVQRAAARFVFRDFRRTTSVSSLINTLGWDQLHIRRLASQLTMFYKIHHGLVNIQLPHTIAPAPFIGRHDHQFKFTVPEATIDPYKYSFYPRSIRLWNQLPSTAVLAPSAAIFQEVSLPVIRGMRLPVGSRLLYSVSHITRNLFLIGSSTVVEKHTSIIFKECIVQRLKLYLW